MRPRFLIDTVIIIDHLNGIEPATEWLTSLRAGEATISVVTRAEALAGAEPHERAALTLLLNTYACLPIDVDCADLAADLRRRNRWKLPDAFQAALASTRGLQLVTRNTRDFSEEMHDFVHIPYRLAGQQS